MKKYWDEMPYYEQPTAGEIKRRSSETKEREKAKEKVLEPVIVQGRNIVKNWWGKAWCNNLEQYADYSSRIDRGKRYVRTGAVIDLKIEKGKILAKVQGTRKTPYKTEIRISPLSEERCQEITGKCGKKLENVEELLAGRFPEEMKELFCGKNGLFPSNLMLFFELRGMEIGHFIDVTLANKVEAMLANVDTPSSRIMKEDEISGLFGVL